MTIDVATMSVSCAFRCTVDRSDSEIGKGTSKILTLLDHPLFADDLALFEPYDELVHWSLLDKINNHVELLRWESLL